MATTQALPFTIEEATIREIHAAFANGGLTCRSLLTGYLQRIAAYDTTGPTLRTIITINDGAFWTADSLDRRFTAGGARGPLHCIPFIVKDNLATAGLRTTAGSIALVNLVPTRDAFSVQRLKAAGAIVFAKGHLSEFAMDYWRTSGSVMPGETRNPYALEYTPAGSSGGVASAVAANLAAAGLATESGKSIRGPAAYTGLVGMRTTAGLVSTAGAAPLRADVVGPMTRTVEDLAAILNVLVAMDAADPLMTEARHRVAVADYRAMLVAEGLRGARIGVVRQRNSWFRPEPEVMRLFEVALSDLRRFGAILVDSIPVDKLLDVDYDADARVAALARRRRCDPFKFDLDDWLAGYSPAGAPTTTAILADDRVSVDVKAAFKRAAAVMVRPADNPACARGDYADSVRVNLLQAMDSFVVDALVYPAWVTPPSLVGGPMFDDTEMLSLLAGITQFPAITVPMGDIGGRIPVGIEFLGRPWGEGTLIRLAYAFERGTHHRRAPETAPPLARSH